MLRFEKRAQDCAANKIREITKATGLHSAAAALLCARGIDTPEAAYAFLHPGMDQLHDPLLLPDMAESVARIRRAVDGGERITVFCDYDADGTCGGSALYLCLKKLGAAVDIRTPNRHLEGYGLNTGAVDDIAAAGATLIVTVDCGITNIGETAYARQRGIDVIITDHHECGEILPDTLYIINAKRPGSTYPCPDIAGCGVAFKLIHALTSLTEAMRYIDLAAVGTITDIVPLLGENRAIASLGIHKMRRDPAPGIAALSHAAGMDIGAITSQSVSFGLGPRINAAGRMDTAQTAIEILSAVCTDAALARRAAALCALNDARRQDVETIVTDAEKEICDNAYMKDTAIMLAGDDWNAGVIGIAAARIADKYTRPCILFALSGDALVGSARSIPDINIYEVLSVFAERYDKFGGHAQAAGLTIQPDVLSGLRCSVCGYIADRYDESVFDKRREYDLALDPADITPGLVNDLERLAPFGACNVQPQIAVFGADITATRYVGKEAQHLKFVMEKNGAGMDAISFHFKTARSFISRRCDFLCEASINDYNGKPQFVVRDVAVHYDKRLVDGFIKANRACMAERFLDEIVQMGGADGGADAGAFSDMLKAEMERSRYGLCIAAGTQPALMWLMQLQTVRAALEDGTLTLYDRCVFAPDNCIAADDTPGHMRLLRIGAGTAFFDERMRALYRQHVTGYHLDRDALLGLYRAMAAFSAPRTPRQIQNALRITPEQTAFMLRVFTQLRLIERGKSDMILALKNDGPKKDLRQSACFAAIDDIVKER